VPPILAATFMIVVSRHLAHQPRKTRTFQRQFFANMPNYKPQPPKGNRVPVYGNAKIFLAAMMKIANSCPKRVNRNKK